MKTEQAAFTIQEMLPIGLTIVVLGIALAYGLQVQGDVQDDIGEQVCTGTGVTGYNSSTGNCYQGLITNDSVDLNPGALNASADAIEGVAKIPEKLPTIVGVIVAAIIIGIVIRYFMQQ